MFRLLTLVGMMLLSPSLLAEGQARFISDNVFLYLHGGPGTQYRILGSIEAGQPVTLLPESQEGYSKVIDHKGREGWVQSDMLSADRSFRETLPLVEAELTDTKAKLDDILNSSESNVAELAKTKAQLAQLKATLETTTKERDVATQKLTNLKQNERFEMWKEGGLIAGLGLIIGMILVYLPRPQRRKKSRWM